MKRISTILVLLLLAATVASSIAAYSPPWIPLQGRLTLPDGTPVTGSRQVTFKLYNLYSSQMLWSSGVQTVTFADGLFSILLGADPQPSLDTVDLSGYLEVGITIRNEPEMTPRIRIGSAPYSMSTGSIDGADAGRLNGLLRLYNTSYPVGEVARIGSPNGEPSGELTLRDTSTSPSLMWMRFSDGHPVLLMQYKNSTFAKLDGTFSSGDPAVQLPSGSVSSDELLDEPGVASNLIVNGVELTGVLNFTDVVTVTLTAPEAGFVVVTASAQAGFAETTSPNRMIFQIDNSPGGGLLNGRYQTVGMDSPPNAGYFYQSITAQRTFQVNPGTYTYRLEAFDDSKVGRKYFWNPNISAVYYPTSYGSVVAAVSASEAAQFEHATPVVSGAAPAAVSTNDPCYLVDLRELQAKADAARIAARKVLEEQFDAEMALREAEWKAKQAESNAPSEDKR